jgi:urease accessory protein
MHPLLGIDHLLAMVAVGILAAVVRRPVLVPGAFLAAMAAGGLLGIAGTRLPFGETLVAASVLALGLALVAGRSMRHGAAIGLFAVAGLVHGHAHGLEAPSAGHPAAYVLGFLLATATLHATGAGVGYAVGMRPRSRALIGSIVVGSGTALLAGVL